MTAPHTGKHFIQGAWKAPQGSEVFSSIDPIYGTKLCEASSATAVEVDQAVKAASGAFLAWKKTSFETRLQYLENYKKQLDQQREALAQAIARETGKVLWEARLEITSMIGKIDASVKAYQTRSAVQGLTQEHTRSVLRHRPHGVIAVFGPFNFPGHLPGSHIIPALLAGNTIVFKPSEYCPAFSMLMMQCWQDSGLPAGVINMVLGQAQTGRDLSAHPGIQGLFFTGSAHVGCLLHQQFAGHPEKLLVLEMGGNNPLIVWDVKDADAAAYHIIQSAYMTAGQRCVCARRLIISNHASGETILDALIARIKRIQVGPYDQTPEPFMGGLVSRKAALHALHLQQELIQQGANPLVKMQAVDTHSSMLTPGLLEVTALPHRRDEEIFAPLLQVIRVPTFEAAIAEANQTKYGLAAGILSDRVEFYHQFLHESRAGIVNWNRQTTGASALLPFGGTGLSGNHHPSAFYAADYSAYPVASMEADDLVLPEALSPGLS